MKDLEHRIKAFKPVLKRFKATYKPNVTSRVCDLLHAMCFGLLPIENTTNATRRIAEGKTDLADLASVFGVEHYHIVYLLKEKIIYCINDLYIADHINGALLLKSCEGAVLGSFIGEIEWGRKFDYYTYHQTFVATRDHYTSLELELKADILMLAKRFQQDFRSYLMDPSNIVIEKGAIYGNLAE